MKPVLLDTGAIVAWLDRSEKYHESALEALEGCRGPLITCEAVVAESCYLLRAIEGAAEAVLANVAEGIFELPLPLSKSAADVQRTMRKYRDQGIDLADACLIQMAGQYNTSQILTLDRDFQIYRWGRNSAFDLLIDL
jgi:predicted nucleic acid-binding protein